MAAASVVVAAAVVLGAVVTDELEEVEALVAGLELLGAGLELLDAALGEELPHPAITRPALTTTVETSFERFTSSPTDGAVEEIEWKGRLTLTKVTSILDT
jgi:hypothetical protein